MTRGTTGIVAVAAIAAAAALGWWLLGGSSAPRRPVEHPDRTPSGAEAPRAPDGAPAPAADSPAVAEPDPESGPSGPAIRGRVTDRTGKPIAGARVEAREPASIARADISTLPDAVFAGTPPRAEARTGADGAFTLRGLAPGRWDVHASAAGHAPASEPGVLLPPAAAAPPVLLVLGPGHGILVRVLDASGAGVAGAEVAAAEASSGPIPAEEALARARADSKGEARLDGLPPGRLIIAARVGARIAARVVELPGEDEVEIRLGGAATLVVRVVNEGAVPVAGAEVNGFIDAAEGDGGAMLRGTTGSDGEARFEGVIPGRLAMVVAARQGYATGVLGRQGADLDEASAGLVDGGTRRVEIQLRSGASLVGTVLLQPAASPVPGARVTVLVTETLGLLPARTATTDAAGAYRIDDLPAGRIVAFAHGDGVATPGALPGGVPSSGFVRRRDAAPLTVEIAPGPAETRHDLAVEATGSVSGRVLLPDGAPAAGARVEVRPRAGSGGGAREPGGDLPPVPAISGEDGSFRIDAVPRTDALVAAASLEGRVGANSDPFTMAAGGSVEGLELKLGTGGVLAGKVTGPEGRPVAGTRLRLVVRRPQGQGNSPARVADTGAEGTFRFEGVAPGTANLTAMAEGFVTKSVQGPEIGEGAEAFSEIVLEAGLAIRGRVLDAAGAPAAGVRVRARNTDRRPESRVRQASARTGRDGSFVVPDLPAGTFDLETSSPDYPRGAFVGAVPGGPPIEFRLPEAVRISGRVTDPSGNPIAGVRVQARGESGDAGSSPAADDGTFEIRNLAPGSYSIQVRSATPGWSDARVDGVEGGTRGMEIKLARSLAITGKVLGPDGGPAPGRGRIRVLDRDGKQVASTRWDGQGGFALSGLTEGSFTLHARVDGTPALVGTATARAGADPIEIRLSAE